MPGCKATRACAGATTAVLIDEAQDWPCSWFQCARLALEENRDDGIDRGLLYVAMTRAEDMLVILHSSSSSYVEELYRALGTVPP